MAPRRDRRADNRRGGAGSAGDGTGRGPSTHWRADGRPKTRFASAAEAHRFALQVRLEHGHDPVVYRCELCDGWHLGGRPW